MNNQRANAMKDELELFQLFGIPTIQEDENMIIEWRNRIGTQMEERFNRDLRSFKRDISRYPSLAAAIQVFYSTYSQLQHPLSERIGQRMNQMMQELKMQQEQMQQQNQNHLTQMSTVDGYAHKRPEGSFIHPNRPVYEPLVSRQNIYDYNPSDFKFVSSSGVNMDENMLTLSKLILDLKKDVKKIREAQTFNGAKRYVDKHNEGKQEKYKWGVAVEDINQDGFDDIIIHDQNKRAKVVNGWTVTQQDPLKAKYQQYIQDNFGYGIQRKRTRARDPNAIKSYDKWLKEHIVATYDPNHPFDTPRVDYSQEAQPWINAIHNANEKFFRDTGVNNIYKPHKPRRKTANQVFTQFVIKPIYNQIIERIRTGDELNGPSRAKFIKAVASIIAVAGPVYKTIVVPEVQKVLEARKMTVEQAKKMKDPKTGETYYSALCKAEVSKYLKDGNYNRSNLVTALEACITGMTEDDLKVPRIATGVPV